ncbi:hypothetical protein Q9189_007281 [Teloschistes chrysophthalmus]
MLNAVDLGGKCASPKLMHPPARRQGTSTRDDTLPGELIRDRGAEMTIGDVIAGKEARGLNTGEAGGDNCGHCSQGSEVKGKVLRLPVLGCLHDRT